MQFCPYKGRILGPDKNPKSGLMSDLFRTKFLEFGTDRNPQNRGFWDPTLGLKVGGPALVRKTRSATKVTGIDLDTLHSRA